MNITQTLEAQNINFDRYLGSTLVLPFTGFERIKIQPNDIATEPVINLALSKLYDNFLFLYKCSRVASNIIPVSQVAIAGVSGTGGIANTNDYRWYTYSENLSTSDFQQLANASLGNLDNTNVMVVAENKALRQFSVFSSSGQDLVVYRGDTRFVYDAIDYNTTFTQIISTNQIYNASGVYWQGINDMCFGADNTLYVIDLSGNRLVKYDATGFFTDDNIFYDNLVFKDTIGGFGSHSDANLFYAPRSVDIYDSYVYVLDSGNGVVKKFDKDLNWVTTYRLFRDFLSAYPMHLSHDGEGNMYVLTNQDKILKYDSNFQNKIDIPLDSLSAQDEHYIKLVFSPSDDNVVYLLSDKNVYKKLLTKPDEDVGIYLPYLFRVNTEETYTNMASLSTRSGDGDLNFIFSKSQNGVGKIMLYYDNLNLFDVLASKDFDIYTFEDIKINKNEYLQNWVFNKAIGKLLLNHIRLRDQVVGKFLAKRDTKNNITFRGTRYFLPDELEKIQFKQDITYFIGMNEIFQNNIANRSLEKIFNIQVELLNALQADISTSYDKGETVFIN